LDNYAWGVLELAAGEGLELVDGDTIAGGALYVTDLLLGGGLDQIGSITGNGLSIYYDALSEANAYLGSQTYSLTGGGVLAPLTSVPEPSTGLLLGFGLTLVAHVRRRGRQSGRT